MTTLRRLSAITFSALISYAASTIAFACPVCFQMEDGPVSEGVRTAVFVLMGVTACVLGVFGGFVIRLARASRNQ